MTHRRPLLLGLFLIAATLACGGGSDDAVTPVLAAKGASLAARFIPDVTGPGVLTVSTEHASASGNTVVVAVAITGTSRFFGANFDLTYDDQRFQYVSASAGDLIAGYPQFDYLANSATSGVVRIGVTSLGGDGVDVASTTSLIEIAFRALGPGNGPLRFAPGAALYDDSRSAIDVQVWAGGTLLAN